jgi:hypothetical protein
MARTWARNDLAAANGCAEQLAENVAVLADMLDIHSRQEQVQLDQNALAYLKAHLVNAQVNLDALGVALGPYLLGDMETAPVESAAAMPGK